MSSPIPKSSKQNVKTAAIPGLNVSEQRRIAKQIRHAFDMRSDVVPFWISDGIAVNGASIEEFCLQALKGFLIKRRKKTLQTYQKTHQNSTSPLPTLENVSLPSNVFLGE